MSNLYAQANKYVFSIMLVVFGVLSSGQDAIAFGQSSRFVLADDQDANFSMTGTWTAGNTSYITAQSAAHNTGYYGETFQYADASGSSTETATAVWPLGNIVPGAGSGSYSFEAFVPDSADNSGSSLEYRLESTAFSGSCGSTYTTAATFSGLDANAYEGRWMPLGNSTLSSGNCYRLVLSNKNNTGAVIKADAVRAERLFENSTTITDMPRIATSFAAGTTNITSSTSATPTIVTSLSVTCPAAGSVLVMATGEAAAVTNVGGTTFNGVALSISKNSTATDNNNVLQSSSLAVYNGDANRDFVNVQRVDTCTANEAITYRFTAYRAQSATGPGSFIWNGRLTSQFFAQSF